jgi:hypothetical protein
MQSRDGRVRVALGNAHSSLRRSSATCTVKLYSEQNFMSEISSYPTMATSSTSGQEFTPTTTSVRSAILMGDCKKVIFYDHNTWSDLETSTDDMVVEASSSASAATHIPKFNGDLDKDIKKIKIWALSSPASKRCTVRFYKDVNFGGDLLLDKSVTWGNPFTSGALSVAIEDKVSSVLVAGDCGKVELIHNDKCQVGHDDNMVLLGPQSVTELPSNLDNDICKVTAVAAPPPPCPSPSRRCTACTVHAPTNGRLGTCTGTLAAGSSCQPFCNDGYHVSGETTCHCYEPSCSGAGEVVEATCKAGAPSLSGKLTLPGSGCVYSTQCASATAMATHWVTGNTCPSSHPYVNLFTLN